MKKNTKKPGKKHNLYPANIIIFTAVIIFIIRLFFLDIMQVKGSSMEPTILPGSTVFINRLSYGIILPFVDNYIIRWNKPSPGDIIVFYNPQKALTIKRCIATEYDKINYFDGLLYTDYLDEPVRIGYSLQFNSINTVPEGQVLVLGDNLSNSIDSRLFGFIKNDDIIGSVLFYK
jgi:signal peptidase I